MHPYSTSVCTPSAQQPSVAGSLPAPAMDGHSGGIYALDRASFDHAVKLYRMALAGFGSEHPATVSYATAARLTAALLFFPGL